MTLKVVGGKDLEEREARAAARRRARPILARWLKEGEAHARGERSVKLRQVHVALMRVLANCGPSANDGTCYAGQARLGQAIGAAQRTARRHLAELVAAGLLNTQRRGFARTSNWTFCIGGVPLFDGTDRPEQAARDRPEQAARDRPEQAARDRPKQAARDRPGKADKPFLDEPLESEPFEIQPTATPTPPPSLPPRAQGTTEIASAIWAAVPVHLRTLPVWKALPGWIEATCSDDDVQPIDVLLGVTGALPSLNGTTLSTLRYFDRAVVRASDARRRDLPSGDGGYVLLKPYSDEWHAERTRKIAAGESIKFMDAQADAGGSWAAERKGGEP
jgi:hypothetical protein